LHAIAACWHVQTVDAVCSWQEGEVEESTAEQKQQQQAVQSEQQEKAQQPQPPPTPTQTPSRKGGRRITVEGER
jgi:hypothetical protein